MGNFRDDRQSVGKETRLAVLCRKATRKEGQRYVMYVYSSQNIKNVGLYPARLITRIELVISKVRERMRPKYGGGRSNERNVMRVKKASVRTLDGMTT
jgi:hypothetical protein